MTDVVKIAEACGARIFGKKIVIADDGISGSGTKFVEKFAKGLREHDKQNPPKMVLVGYYQFDATRNAYEKVGDAYQNDDGVIPLFRHE